MQYLILAFALFVHANGESTSNANPVETIKGLNKKIVLIGDDVTRAYLNLNKSIKSIDLELGTNEELIKVKSKLNISPNIDMTVCKEIFETNEKIVEEDLRNFLYTQTSSELFQFRLSLHFAEMTLEKISGEIGACKNPPCSLSSDSKRKLLETKLSLDNFSSKLKNIIEYVKVVYLPQELNRLVRSQISIPVEECTQLMIDNETTSKD